LGLTIHYQIGTRRRLDAAAVRELVEHIRVAAAKAK